MRWMIRELFGLALVVAACLAVAAPGAAQDVLSGKVEIFSATIAPGIGLTRGDGTLRLPDGRTYEFSVENFTLFAVGASKMHAEGEVSSMRSVRDFEGTYTLIEAGAAIGGGLSALMMRNENGVVMKLTATQLGLNLTLGSGRMSIKVKSNLL